MGKQSLVVVGLIIFILISNYITFVIVHSLSISDRDSVLSTEDDALLFKEDYPLIEVMLDKKYNWVLVIREFQGSGKESHEIITRVDAMECNRENISVLTFPVGRGITPSGCLYLYRDNTLIKEVPFVSVTISNKSLLSHLQTVPYKKVKQLIHGELPPLF